MKKKALAMALGAMMAAGAASQANAASQVDFTGYYRAYYVVESNLDHQSGDAAFTDSFFAHRLNLEIAFTPTDEISVHWRLRAPNLARWGAGSLNPVTHFLYGRIKQDWGTVYVGRVTDVLNRYGLASLGYGRSTDPVFTATGPFESNSPVDAIRYVNTWDNGFGLLAQYAKVSTGVADNTVASWSSDHDLDGFRVEPRYEWDGGGAALGLVYERNATFGRTSAANGGDDKRNAWYLNPAFSQSFGDFGLHFEGLVGWASTEVKGLQADGTTYPDRDEEGYGFYLDGTYNYGPGNVALAGWWASGTGLGGNSWYEDENGVEWWTEQKSKSLVDFGTNFYPLVVAFGDSRGWQRSGGYSDLNVKNYSGNANAVTVANNAFTNFVLGPGGLDRYFGDDEGVARISQDRVGGYTIAHRTAQSTPAGAGASWYDNEVWDSLNSGTSNHWALALTGNHSFTDEIALHWAVAYLGLNKPNYRITNSFSLGNDLDNLSSDINTYTYAEQDKDLGWEIDLGLEFRLLDNLRLTTTFGYLFSGDAYRTLRGYNVGAENSAGENLRAVRAVWEDPKDAYGWYNVLQFSF
ncbi:MAG: hypothetical protein LBS31_06360 [Candidatus Adiutrix sp.]|jgi:hypothetical protein|nr:hypothetical protein [Candidatus Adiutrix sp.]